MIVTAENEERGERLLPVSLCPPQIPQKLVCDHARSFVVQGCRTMASATVQLVKVQYYNSLRPLRVMVMDISTSRKLLAVSTLINLPCDCISFHKITVCNAVGWVTFQEPVIILAKKKKDFLAALQSFNGT
jgi:hypothetical protein